MLSDRHLHSQFTVLSLTTLLRHLTAVIGFKILISSLVALLRILARFYYGAGCYFLVNILFYLMVIMKII